MIDDRFLNLIHINLFESIFLHKKFWFGRPENKSSNMSLIPSLQDERIKPGLVGFDPSACHRIEIIIWFQW
jgi:hypothetical protein